MWYHSLECCDEIRRYSWKYLVLVVVIAMAEHRENKETEPVIWLSRMHFPS
jgi:hypothetical protein